MGVASQNSTLPSRVVGTESAVEIIDDDDDMYNNSHQQDVGR